MSNLTDAIIAAKLMGNGGGGGGGGLPPITTETETIVETQSLSFTSSYGMLIAAVAGALVADTNYTVSFDGTDYDVTGFLFSGIPTAGNLAIAEMGADTGEPFLCQNDSGQIMIAVATGATHTVGISSSTTNYPDGSILIAIGGEWQKAEGYGYEVEEGGVPTVHKIDNKYLPFLTINVDTHNQTIDCDYLTYKAAVKAGVPIWLCDTANKNYYVLEGGELTVTNPILTGSRWAYDSTKSAGHRLLVSLLSVFMQVGSSGWSVTKVDSSVIEIPNV